MNALDGGNPDNGLRPDPIGRSSAPAALIWLLPLGALLVAAMAKGMPRDLSIVYSKALLISLFVFVPFVFIEKALPSAGPHKPSPQVIVNLQIGVLILFCATLTGAAAGFLASVVTRHLAVRQIDLSLHSTDSLPALMVTLVLSWLIYDFFYYWYHRSQHTFSVLWQVHKFHHVEQELSLSTRFRENLTDVFLTLFFILIPIALFFRLDPVATAKYGIFMKLASELMGGFKHLNIRLALGWASPLIVGPQTHRIHHSRLAQHRNWNFGGYFPIWDVLFGTYYHPSRTEFPPSGVEGELDVRSVREALMLPYKGWWGMFQDWRRRPA